MSASTTVSKLAEKLSWLVAIILVLLPFHALLFTWAGSNFGHLDLFRIWKEILVVLMVPPLVWIIIKMPKLKSWFFRSWIVRLYGLYFVLHLVLGAWAYTHQAVNGTALIYGLLINLRFIGFFIICALLATRSGFLNRHWKTILIAPSAVVIFFGLLQKFFLDINFLRHFGYGPKTIPAYSTLDNNLAFRRIQSTLRGPNPLGAYLVFIVTYLVSTLKRRSYKNLSLLLAGLIVMFYSYSRSALLGTFLALGCLFLWRPFNKNRKRMLVAGAIVLIIIGSFIFVSRNNTHVQETVLHISSESSSPNSSNSIRVEQLKLAIKDIAKHPLGSGPGTAGPASVRNDHPSKISENYFLQIAQEVGVVGVVVFISINIFVARELWPRRQDQLPKILLASLVGITLINLVSHAWTDDTLAYLWWGLAGIAISPGILQERLKHGGEKH